MNAYIVRVDEIVVVIARHDLVLGYSYKMFVCTLTRCLRVVSAFRGGKNCKVTVIASRAVETKRVNLWTRVCRKSAA